MKLSRIFIAVLFIMGLLCLGQDLLAQDDQDPGRDIAVISLEAGDQNNYAYITHSGNITERWKERLGNNQTITYIAGNFDGTAADSKDDIACLDFDENDDPYAFTESSFGVTPIESAWTNILRTGDKKYYYFVSGDFDGDGNADIATFYRDFAGTHPESDVRAKITYGPTGARQTADEDDWLLPEERSAGFITGNFVGTTNQNDTIKDIAAIHEVDGNYQVQVYGGPDGTPSEQVWNINLFSNGEVPVAFGAGDFNGDGWDDIAIAYYIEDEGFYGAYLTLNPSGTGGIVGWSLGYNSYDSILFQDFNKDGFADIAGVIDNHAGSRTAKIFYGNAMAGIGQTSTWTLKGDKPVTQYLAGDFGRFKGTVSGRVFQKGGGLGLGGATVTMKLRSNNQVYATVTTDENGDYTFTNIVNNNYIVAASKTGHGFTPSSTNITVFDANVSGVNFTSTNCPSAYRISGRVWQYKEGGVPDTGLQGIVVTGTGTISCDNSPYSATTTTDSSGYYSLSVTTGSFVVTPSNPRDGNFTFTPASRSVAVMIDSVSNVDFVGANDACPYDPNKTAAGACGCGVPDLDENNDGVADCIDLCPDDPEKRLPGACGCGIADVDLNSDGVIDCIDKCPNDPSKILPGICGCGVPDVDFDNDGLVNCNDQCPNDANKVVPGICGCGVPDVDSNNDGTMDCVDLCPNDPAKTSPGLCGCGKPDVDANGNGVCDTDEADKKYTIAGRIVSCIKGSSSNSNPICQGNGNLEGLGGVIVHSAVGRAMTKSLAEYKKCYPNEKDPDSKVGSYQIPDPCAYLNEGKPLSEWEPVSSLFDGNHEEQRINYELHKIKGAYTFWVRALEDGQGYRVVRYFNLQANNRTSGNKFIGCPSRDTFQYDTKNKMLYNYNSNIPLLIDDTERYVRGGEFCRFDPVSLYRDMIEMDFLVVGCLPGWKAIEAGYCVKQDPNIAPLLPPINVQASVDNKDQISITWDTSAGATDYHLYRSQLTSFQGQLAAKHINKVDARILSTLDFVSDEYIGSKYNIVKPGTVTFIDKTATPGVRYVYAVRAGNIYQKSDFSDVAIGYRLTGTGDDNFDPDGPLVDCTIASAIDSDGDGVSNAVELQNGTNPCDRGSYLVKLSSPVYTKYNTFLGQVNYLELTSTGTKTVATTIRIFNSKGKELGRKRVYVNPNSEMDVDISGWVYSIVQEVDQIGLVRIDFNSNEDNVSLSGRMSVYREAPGQEYVKQTDKTYSFAYARELRNHVRGSSYLIANTTDPMDQGRKIPNWVEINNLEWSPRTFIVNYYDSNGTLLRSKRVSPNKLGESDIQGGHEIGSSTYLIEIIPIDGATKYLASLMRYGTADSAVAGKEEFNFGIQMEAKAGIGDRHVVPISHLQRDCWLQANQVEIANVKNKTVNATVRYYNKLGKQVASENIRLRPHQQIVKNADALLDVNEIGSAQITSDYVGSIVTQSTFYYHDCEENMLQTAYNVQAMIGGEAVQYGSYNRYLGMDNTLTVMNTTGANAELYLNTQQSGSRDASPTKKYTLSKYMTMAITDGIKRSTLPDSYGTLKLDSVDKNKLGSMNLRIRQSEGRIDFAMPTVVR